MLNKSSNVCPARSRSGEWRCPCGCAGCTPLHEQVSWEWSRFELRVSLRAELAAYGRTRRITESKNEQVE
jgi:hypothetical protein